MIISEMCQTLLYEDMIPNNNISQQFDPSTGAPIPPVGPGGEISPQPDGTDETGDPAEFMPLKKYYLIQQLQDLRIRLSDNNLYYEDLDILLKFVNNLTYKTILLLADQIVEYTSIQLQNANKKDKKKGSVKNGE